MPSSTPQFTAALHKYFQSVGPGGRVCSESGVEFYITSEEFVLYRSLGVPLPTLSPAARFRRQRAHLGGLDFFTCAYARQPLVTVYDPESPVQVLPSERWFSDQFDGFSYGRGYDFNRPFFDQWQEFSRSVPRPALLHDLASANSDWCSYDVSSKNCYLTHSGVENEQLLYSDWCVRSSFCLDSIALVNAEWCYESVRCTNSSQVFFSEYCDACLSVYFSFDCESCTDCFGCVGLRNKRFCFFNEQLSEAEYRARLREIDLSDARVVTEFQIKAKEFWKSFPHPAGRNYTSENSMGDDLVSCRSVRGVSAFEVDTAATIFDVAQSKYCADITTSSYLERSVNVIASLNGYENKMAIACVGCRSVEYSELCYSSENCFGCIGLRYKQFCIFNREYSEAEYWRIVDHIKTELLKRGEYGMFFPVSTTLFAYNTSHAGALYPLSKDEVLSLGGRWYEDNVFKTAQAELPPCLSDFAPVLVGQLVAPAGQKRRPFAIIQAEYDFHKRFNLALPTEHPTLRRQRRIQGVWPIHLTDRKCGSCSKKISTRVDDSRVPVWCEDCLASRR